jgi:class 3 adenylate cyclase
MSEASRRLAGILAADVVGYSAMVGTDEPGTFARLRGLRAEVVQPLAATHGGRLFKTTGDGFLVEFASAVQALRCAIAIQDALRAQPDGLRLRIGVHQGEVVPEGDEPTRRRCHRRGPAGAAGRAGRHLHFSPRARGCGRQDGSGGG